MEVKIKIMTQHCVCEDSWFMLLILSLVYEGRCKDGVFRFVQTHIYFMITASSTPLRKRRTHGQNS